MEQINLIIGSPEWLAWRAQHWPAGDAAAMLNCSPFIRRNDYLHQLHTGVAPDPTQFEQMMFDEGHEFEALARPLAQEVIGDDLAPILGRLEGTKYTASFDGLDFSVECPWEHKRLNAALREALPHPGPDGNDSRNVPKYIRLQLEQQLMVSGAKRSLLTASEWEVDPASGEWKCKDVRHCWYESDPALRREIELGWPQRDADLAAYVPHEPAPKVKAEPVESLPAIAATVSGSLTIKSNVDAFSERARRFIATIPKTPTTDEEFAECDAKAKELRNAESLIKAAKASAIAQVEPVEVLLRTLDDVFKIVNRAAIDTENAVKAQKVKVKEDEVRRGREALAKYVADLNRAWGRELLPLAAVPNDFPAQTRNLKNFDSLRNAIDSHLSACKMVAADLAERIQRNLNHLTEHASAHKALFADAAQLVLKDHDAVVAIVKSRIADFEAEQARKLEAERAKIRAEEEARAAAKVRQEQEAREAEERRQRVAAEEAQRRDQIEKEALTRSEPQQRSLPPAGAPLAAPAVSSPAGNVHPMPTRAPAGPPTLQLSEIKRRLAINGAELPIPAAYLQELGFPPAGRDRSAVLFHESDWPRICEALIKHIAAARDQRRVA